MHEKCIQFNCKRRKKRSQPKVNTVQVWSKNYSCSFFLYDDYFTLWVPRISLGNKNQILVNTVQKKTQKYHLITGLICDCFQNFADKTPNHQKVWFIKKEKSLVKSQKSLPPQAFFFIKQGVKKPTSNYKLNSNEKIRNFHVF